MDRIRAWAAPAAAEPLALRELDFGPLGAEDVEIAVEYCGICHSDLSVLENEWGASVYPCVPGHEAVGRIVAVGDSVKGRALGDRVGVGWNAGSCMHCRFCLSGSQQLCPQAQPTIMGHWGAFAERLRAHWAWTIPLPEGLDASAAGPLLCGGITVFAPLLTFQVKPTDRVGVVGIGGLGHMALLFLKHWGCEVTAFTSSPAKYEQVKALGAHRAISSRDPSAMGDIAGSLDFLLVTVNVPLDWNALMTTLAPHGRMHVVGAVLEPIPIQAMQLIQGQQSVSGSPTGSPVEIATMLDFAARHGIAPHVRHYPMSRVNEALEHLRSDRPPYRIVLDADF